MNMFYQIYYQIHQFAINTYTIIQESDLIVLKRLFDYIFYKKNNW